LKDDSAAIAREQTIGGELGDLSGERWGLELKMRGIDALLSTTAVSSRSEVLESMSGKLSKEEDGDDGRRPII
jgi:hypothetical protein